MTLSHAFDCSALMIVCRHTLLLTAPALRQEEWQETTLAKQLERVVGGYVDSARFSG